MASLSVFFPARSFYRVGEVAEIIGISRTAAYELVKTGEIASVRIQGAIRVSRGAILRFVDQVEASASMSPAA